MLNLQNRRRTTSWPEDRGEDRRGSAGSGSGRIAMNSSKSQTVFLFVTFVFPYPTSSCASIQMFATGTKVQIQGLANAKELNGVQGSIMSFNNERDRYKVDLPGGSRMVKKENLGVIGGTEAPEAPVFENEAAMLAHLGTLGMNPAMLANLTPEQKQKMWTMTQRKDIVDRASATHRGANAERGTMNAAAGGLYEWKDESDHVYMEVKCEDEAKCTITADHILIESAGGEVILQGNLFQAVDPENSTSSVKEDGESGKKLGIYLRKAAPMRWLMVTR
jgi:hypothetical protein